MNKGEIMKKQKNIGVSTIGIETLIDNYGSFFQHYALRHYLRECGFSPFRRDACQKLTFKRFLRFYYIFFRKYVFSFFFANKRFRLYLYKNKHRRKFKNEYTMLIGPLHERIPKMGIFYRSIVGGDSVWMSRSPCDYLLDCPLEVKRIAYAVSSNWDRSSQDPQWINLIKKVIETFSFVGIRERVGVEIYNTIAKREIAKQVLDPVFLYSREHYLSLAKENSLLTRPTLLYYVVNIWEEKELNLDLMKSVAEALSCDLKIVGIQGAEQFIPKKNLLDPSPCEFLSLLRDCNYFVTNSFHGLVFAVIFQKQFAFINQTSTRHGNQNCRQHELLKMFSCEERIYQNGLNLSSLLKQPINFENILNILEEKRIDAMRFLREALQ